MKTKRFDMSPRREPLARRRMRQPSGMSGGLALLGGACVIGVFAVLALLYSFG